jgi:chitin disaccharide deacetylase
MKKSKRLIVNADGFGFTYGNNQAIFEAAKAGSISSISVNTNFPAVSELPSFYKSFPHISIGIHLNPVVGKPVSDPAAIATLVGPDGEFWGKQFRSQILKRHIDLEQLFQEMLAQIRVVLHMGVPVSHLDSHQNQHLLPGFFQVFIRIAKVTSIIRMRSHRHFIGVECAMPKLQAARFYATHPKTLGRHIYTRWLMRCAKRQGMKMADRLLAVGYVTGATKGGLLTWQSILSNLPVGVSEIYCHPGYPDDTLRQYAECVVDERIKELEVLLSPQLRQLLVDYQIDLVGYNDI